MISTISIKGLRRLVLDASNKKLLSIAFVLTIIDLALSLGIYYLTDTGAYHLNGEYIEPHDKELLKLNILGLLISYPILSILIGSITTLFIKRELPYKKRFLKGCLLTLITIYFIFSLAGLYKLVTSI